MQETIKKAIPDKLKVHLGSVKDLIIEEGQCRGITLESGEDIRSNKVIITTGTFLGGRCYIG
jgi:tRNA uridine 5-carboxymethylaminomethyl modification enzyme